jgi:hypothetical protein
MLNRHAVSVCLSVCLRVFRSICRHFQRSKFRFIYSTSFDILAKNDFYLKNNQVKKSIGKAHDIGTDGVMQMAIQLAHYRLHGHFVSTYESGKYIYIYIQRWLMRHALLKPKHQKNVHSNIYFFFRIIYIYI